MPIQEATENHFNGSMIGRYINKASLEGTDGIQDEDRAYMGKVDCSQTIDAPLRLLVINQTRAMGTKQVEGKASSI